MIRAAALALLLATPAAGQVGRTWHYSRSNGDGSLAEAVHVHVPAAGQLAVMKAQARCTQAALVTARIDPATGQASELVGGQLRRDGGQQAFAWFREDGSGQLTARAALPEGELKLVTPVGTRPWHLYDFDFASLTLWLANRPDRRADFRIGLPLLLIGPQGPTLTDLGALDGRFLAETHWMGKPALVFQLHGPALGGKSGSLVMDAIAGHILEARLPIPNHDGYRDFRLRLTGISDGAAAWAEARAAHWRGCRGG
ncbi:hypothetical protein [Sandarakinorhabdus sp. AAP62]|uniref:hypothetical protein n=1 Tax=Sandarakinorhabdus sp. AAP62 TaxID=1248916 RepID=UPI0002EE0E85|nr:hypothetical protein [Sandarakinorhabdus sp. AAP62]